MRILFFSPYYYPYVSGVTTYPQKILKHLSKKHKITVITFRYSNQLKTHETHDQYSIIRMPYWFMISKGFISPQSLIYFYKQLKTCDLVILNQPNFEGLILSLMARLFNKQIISIFHCQVFLSNNIINHIINWFLNLSMRIQLLLSHKIVVYTKDYITSLPYFNHHQKKVIEILPPIESHQPDKKFLQLLKQKKKNRIWIGYAGRISTEKGLEYLTKAVNQLKNKDKYTIVFAGPYGHDVSGENQYYQQIISLLNQYQINHIFLGNLTSQKLTAFYQSIDILTLTSINQTEAFGMVQAESMINGTPVIASNLPGVRMPITLTKMGIVTQPTNIKQITQAIENIVNNKNKYTNNQLINRAKTIFNINNIYQVYNRLINNLNN